jgi:hypothetical protein
VSALQDSIGDFLIRAFSNRLDVSDLALTAKISVVQLNAAFELL